MNSKGLLHNSIEIKGAREHNLKNIDVSIPRGKLVVFTGVSGSGKSSLAFDTIYAEGQRRYVESLSAYARQFLGLMDKPDVDSIDGLSPAISIDQKSTSHNPRSTVGTITETYDYLRLLFARVGHPHCSQCGREIARQTPQHIADTVLEMGKGTSGAGTRFWILSPVVRDRRGEFSQLFQDLSRQGHSTVRVDGVVRNLDDDFVLLRTNRHSIDVVVDRLIVGRDAPASLSQRIVESVETALRLSSGLVIVSEIRDSSFTMPEIPTDMHDHLFSERFACPVCSITLAEIEPRIFSFNSPHGACPTCTGIGTLQEVDPELVFNPKLTLAEGGILPWSRLSSTETWSTRLLSTVAQEHGFSMREVIGALSPEIRTLLLSGTGNRIYRVRGENRFGHTVYYDTTFEGVIPNLTRRYKETESDYVRREIGRYMSVHTCADCKGTRLKLESLSITICGESIARVASLPIQGLREWITTLTNESSALSARERVIARPILREIATRVSFLLDVGLDYLTLDRTAYTLAGGEMQRIRLASQIGTGLTGVLYVLDEPSIGLHQRDNNRLIRTLEKLKELGNSVIVVEHDKEMMQRADWILDFGPGAGEHGGTIVFAGTPEALTKHHVSLTGKYLSGTKVVKPKKLTAGLRYTHHKSRNTQQFLTIRGAREHNLKDIDVTFPLGKFIAVTGVSGSGKSTLVHDILYRALQQRFGHRKEKPGMYLTLEGGEHIDKAIMIDQSPIGRTPRSNPATYTGLFTPVRELFAHSQLSRMRGYGPGRFSFNVKGGRCEACEGEGQIKIEMQFLADVYVTCEVCNGTRYNREALEVTIKGKSIAEVLSMPVENALSFFAGIPAIYEKLEVLSEVGLGYIRLGQPAPTLSGGEAQRIKLAAELSRRPTGHTLYLLDEPTTGLHFADIERLLSVLRRLTDMGNTVVIIEHNLDVCANVDWIIDLGPEGGDEGGKVVTQGTPREIAKAANSYTGQYLAPMLG